MEATRGQGSLWGRAAHDWAELQEPLAAPLWEAMLDAAAVGPGARVLDAGCGAGGASALAACRGALVNGIDAAAALVAIARARVPDGDFQVGDVQALPYADAIFDAVLVANVLPYVTDPCAAVREVRRVCAPGGRVVVAVCDGPETCAQHAIGAAVQELLPASPRVSPCALSAAGAVDGLLADAGLVIDGSEVTPCPSIYPDRATAWQAQVSAAPLQAALQVVGVQAVQAAVERALAPYRTGDGGICLHTRFRYVVARPAVGPCASG